MSAPAPAIAEAVDKAKEVAAATQAKATEAFGNLQSAGFFDHIKEYGLELLTPWTVITSNEELMGPKEPKEKALYVWGLLLAELKAAFTLSPATPENSFKFYNVIGLWIGIFESLIFSLLGHGLFSLIWNGGIGFLLAYTMFFTMIISKTPKYMFYGLCLIALYVLFNVYMGMKTLLFVVPAALYFTKALCDLLMLVNGFVLYKQVIGDGASLIPSD